MKIVVFICLLVFPTLAVFSQNNNQGIGIYSSVFNGGGGIGWGKGYTSPNIENTFLIGAEYNCKLYKRLRMNIGLEYSKRSVSIGGVDPFSPGRYGHIQYFTVPVYLRFDFWKYIFFTFGAIIDVAEENDITKSHSVIGITGGTGFKYDFKNSMTIFLHPFYQVHNAANINEFVGGVRTGISYRF